MLLRAVMCGSLVALAACDLIKDDGSVALGKGVDTPDSAWVVTSATDLGQTLAPVPAASFKKPLTTAGRFVRVHYNFTPKKEKFVAVDSPVLVDEAGHEIKAMTDNAYVPSNAQVFDTSPGTIGQFEPIYNVPKDAKKLRAKIVGKATPGLPTLVNLKL
jgi:hypothetical protein